jgi:hypothetical protein
MSAGGRRAMVRCVVLGLIATAAAGCTDDMAASTTPSGVAPDEIALVTAEAWTLLGPSDDPWTDTEQRPRCDAQDMRVETALDLTWLRLSTERCGWLTVRQPLLKDVDVGTPLQAYIWFWAFGPPKVLPAEYEVLVAVGEPPVVVWSARGPLPKDSGILFDVFEAPRALKAGEPVYWHVANHGSNAWEMIRFATATTGAPTSTEPR